MQALLLGRLDHTIGNIATFNSKRHRKVFAFGESEEDEAIAPLVALALFRRCHLKKAHKVYARCFLTVTRRREFAKKDLSGILITQLASTVLCGYFQ